MSASLTDDELARLRFVLHAAFCERCATYMAPLSSIERASAIKLLRETADKLERGEAGR